MRSTSLNHSVLIVGAGPTGLILALSLALHGVSVRIVEKKIANKVGQRGAAIHPRTLEMHRLLGTEPDILSVASVMPMMAVYAKGSSVSIKTIDMIKSSGEPSDAFPTTKAMMLGQDKQIEILRSHFEKLGGKVEAGTELLSVEQFPDRVIARLQRTGEDRVVEETFDYVVGTDGAHSKVRKQLDFSFLGETRATERMVLGDIYIPSMSREFWHVWGEATTSLLMLRPVPETPGLVFAVISGPDEDLESINDHAALQACIKRITGFSDLECGELMTLALYTPNIRMVDSFRKGRVFVAGDAAHVHTPSGGQGSNSGAQDAFNLGWKLALVIKGLARPSLLDSYSLERIPVIAEMLQLTTNLHGTLYDEGAQSERTWDRGGSLDQLGVNYRGTPFVLDGFRTVNMNKASKTSHYDQRRSGVLMAGDRAPDASSLIPAQLGGIVSDTRLFDIFSPTAHTILAFLPSSDNYHSSVATSIADLLKKYPAGLFTSVGIFPADISAHAGVDCLDVVVKDQLRNARRAYRVPEDGTAIVAVRPDGVVGAMVANVEGLRRYLALVFV